MPQKSSSRRKLKKRRARKLVEWRTKQQKTSEPAEKKAAAKA